MEAGFAVGLEVTLQKTKPRGDFTSRERRILAVFFLKSLRMRKAITAFGRLVPGFCIISKLGLHQKFYVFCVNEINTFVLYRTVNDEPF